MALRRNSNGAPPGARGASFELWNLRLIARRTDPLKRLKSGETIHQDDCALEARGRLARGPSQRGASLKALRRVRLAEITGRGNA